MSALCILPVTGGGAATDFVDRADSDAASNSFLKSYSFHRQLTLVSLNSIDLPLTIHVVAPHEFSSWRG